MIKLEFTIKEVAEGIEFKDSGRDVGGATEDECRLAEMIKLAIRQVMQSPDFFRFELTPCGTWHVRIAGERYDTGAVTEAGAREWLRCYQLQLANRGAPVAVTAVADSL